MGKEVLVQIWTGRIKRGGNGIDTNTVQRCRVDDGPEIHTGIERGQMSVVKGTHIYQRM